MGSLNYLPEIPDPALAHSVPLDNPLHGPPPARFKDGEVLDVVRARVDFVTNLNLKIIPQIDGRPGLRQITSRDLADVTLSGCWSGPGTARIEENAQAPLYRLPVLRHLEGFYWRGEFSLVG